jgi:hypothetical protein
MIHKIVNLNINLIKAGCLEYAPKYKYDIIINDSINQEQRDCTILLVKLLFLKRIS